MTESRSKTSQSECASIYLKKLYLRHFRRYEEAFFQFNPTINTIIGPNAYGKTTILEAIQFLMNGRSFRTQKIPDLIHHDKTHFFVEASFVKQGVEQVLKISYDGHERKIIYNSTTCQSSANLLGLLQGVTITPDHASLIKGAPLVRRHFLDLQIAQVDPLYVHYLTRYTRAMRQRNVLLKHKNLSTIKSWEQEMAVAAAYVTIQRHTAVGDLQKLINPLHDLLTGDQQNLVLAYKSAPVEDPSSLSEHYLHQWDKIRHREKEVGMTLYGPHRDDLLIKIGEKEARLYASEGQQRSCVMALRLAEWQRLKELSHEAPLMLIDDVGISLDASRRQKLGELLKTLGQVFLTCTEHLF